MIPNIMCRDILQSVESFRLLNRFIIELQGAQDGTSTSLLQTSLDRVLCLEDLSQLLQGSLFGLREEEVHDDNLNQIPEHEDEIEIVSDVGERWARTVLYDDGTDRRGKVANRGAFCPGGCWERLGDVHRLQRRPAEGEDDSKHVDECDCAIGRCRVRFILAR
ncbi:hypothetical protein PVAG01_08495 [Phlyctema vagabunda]|uniref:Uncharacterized protein n=1 Tax=Phlyctema vagabunda TaxID=108571 RepID=A0ABR4P9K0_9HELO